MKKYLEYINENTNTVVGEMWIHHIVNQHMDKIKEYIEHGNDINYKSQKGQNTALQIAASEGYIDIVNVLLNHPDIDVNIRNKFSLTPLLEAAEYVRWDCVEALLKHPKIDAEIKDKYDRNFIDYLGSKSFYVKTYSLQKEIIDNGRYDIILFFDKYNLVNPKIKKDYPDLFKAVDWGLIS